MVIIKYLLSNYLQTNISTTFNYSWQKSSLKNHIAQASHFPFFSFHRSNDRSPTNPPFLMTMPTNYCFVDNVSICNSLEAIFYSYGIMMTLLHGNLLSSPPWWQLSQWLMIPTLSIRTYQGSQLEGERANLGVKIVLISQFIYIL